MQNSLLSRRNVLAMLSSTVPAAAICRAQPATGQLKISALEFVRLEGRHQVTAGLNNQPQVNPLDIYDELRPPEYHDQPAGAKDASVSSIYLRLRTEGGLEGLYGPIDMDVAQVAHQELGKFLIGKDALAGETLWDQMYRSNRHSRAGLLLMAISAVDNATWDLRGRHFNVPVYRLLGGPSRKSIEVYASCLGFSLEPEAVRKRCLEIQKEGYTQQKWFLAYGPGSGAEGTKKNVELVRILRETLGDDTELMFDTFSGWDLTYALDWAHRVEKYRPRWMEESTHPEKIEAFATLRRSTTIPVASGEHFYGRWEVERYLEAGALSVVQADPEWCGGISELLKIGTVASLHDVKVIPHGHSLHAAMHVIASQSPMTFPMGEYLVNKMRSYYYFEKNALHPEKGRITLSDRPGFGIEFDPAKVERQEVLKFS
jgi:L-rhamnonate dehydratase